MRYSLSIILFILNPVFCQAQNASVAGPLDFVLWKSERIEAAANKLEKELGDKRLVYELIGNYQGHSMYLVLRGKTSSPELHETESDFQISMRGKATLLIGGELVDAEKRPRKQQRGKSIRGATSHSLSAGDTIHVPPGVPHLLVIEPGQPYLYLLIKIDEEPLIK